MNYSLLIQAPTAEAAAKHSVTGDISIQVEPASRIALSSESGEPITDAALHQEGNDLHISIGTTGTDIVLEGYFLGIATGAEVPVGICGDLGSFSLGSPLNEGLVEGAAYHLLVRAPGTEEGLQEIDINGDTTLPVEASSEVAILNAQGNLVNATISQEGNDLHLLIPADGTEIILQGYFTSGAGGQAPHVAANGGMGSVSDSFAHLISQYQGSGGSLDSLLPAAGLDDFGGSPTDGIEGGAASGAASGGGSVDGFTLMRLSATQYIPFQGSAAPDSGQSPSSGGGGGGATAAPEIVPEVPVEPALVPPSNSAPIAVNNTYLDIAEDGVTNLTILNNDRDPDADPLTIVEIDGEPVTTGVPLVLLSGATVTLRPDGTIDFQPGANSQSLDEGETATTGFTYTISDGKGGTDIATVIVTINGANDAPNTVGSIEDQSNDDADSVTFDVSGHFADVDGEALTFSVTGLPTGLSIDPGTGIISGTIDPSASVSGPYSVTVVASDGDLSTSLTFNWNVANPAPDAVDDTYSIGEDGSAVIGNAITDNDTDPDADVLTATAQTDAAGSNGGLFSIATDGQVSFNANGAFEGLDAGESATTSFTYEISDGEGGTDTATVTVTVNGANDAPNTVGSIDDQSNDDADSVTFDVSGHFADVDGESLTFSASGLPTGLSIDPATGIISGTIDPSASVSGPYNVTVIASDGNLSTSLTFTWNVANPAPDAINDTYSIGEDESAILGNAITGSDSDPDGDVLTATAQTDAAGSNGGLFSIATDGQVSFNANDAFEGLDEGESATTSFTYTISDGEGGSDTATVTVTVNGANDAPNTVGSIDDQSNDDADSVTFDVSGHFADVDGETLTFSASGLPTGLSIDPGTGVISGTIDPSASVSGPYSVTVVASDGDLSTSLTFNWNVANPAPDAVDDTVSTDEDTALVLGVSDIVDPNDTDLDGDTLVISGVSNPTNGSVVLNNDGTVTFTPDAGFHGTATFEYTISDGNGGTDTATVTVNVASVNDTPDAIDDTLATDEDTALVLGVSDIVDPNDTDLDGDTLVISGVSNPTNGSVILNNDGTVTFTPEAGFHGTATFEYTISDGNGGTDTATVTVNVASVNDTPDAIDDSVATDEDTALILGISDIVDPNDTDLDGDTLVISGVSNPTNGTVILNNDGTVTFTPDTGFHGTATFDYTISDGNGGTDTATVTVNVGSINDVPDAIDDSVSTAEDTALVLGVSDIVAPNDTDLDGDTLVISGVSNPTNGSVVLNNNGTVTFTPDAGFHGTATFEYTISDGNGGTDTATVTVNVGSVNDVPDAIDDTLATDEDTALILGVSDIVDPNDTDLDGDTLVISGASNPTNGSVVLNNDGTVTFTPDAGFHGTATFEYTISDGNGGTDTATVTVNVGSINDAPDAIDDTKSTDEDTALVLGVSDIVSPNDTDLDGDTLVISAVSNPSNGSVVLNPDGTVTFTPNAGFHGTATFEYTISDGNGGTDTATVTVNVGSINDAPDAVDDAASTRKDTAIVLGVADLVTPNDTDLDGDTLVISQVSNATNGTVVLNNDGTVTFNPTTGFHGTATFDYTISDGNGGTDSAEVTITVNAPPVVSISAESSSMAVVGNSGVNTSFEEDGNLSPSSSYAFIDESAITGWETTASDGKIEVWDDGFQSRPAFDGDFFIELNANQVSTLWQAVDTTSMQNLLIDFQHGQRSSEQEQIRLLVGSVAPPDKSTSTSIEDLIALGFQEVLVTNTSNLSGWTQYQGMVTLPPGQNTTYVAFQSIPFSGGNSTYGNFLDSINLVGTQTVTMAESDLDLSDVDSSHLISATLTLTNAETGDVLAPELSSIPSGVTYSITHGTGSITIEFSGSATVAEYEAMLDAVGFASTSSISHNRRLEVTVTDNTGLISNVGATEIPFLNNLAPIATDDSFSTDEDAVLSGTVLTNDSDPVGDALTVNTTPVSEVSHGSLVLNANGTFVYTPDPDFIGTDSFSYEISDGKGGIDTATVTINVGPINDAPVDGDETNTVTEDTTLTVTDGTTGDLLNNASDIDGDTLSISAFSVAGHSGPFTVGSACAISGIGSLTINANGSYSFAPASNFTGSIPAITYTVSDGKGGTDTSTLSLTMSAINDAPTPANDFFVSGDPMGSPITINVLANDTDTDGTINSSSVDLNPSLAGIQTSFTVAGQGVWTSDGSGSVTFTPDAGLISQPSPISYTITDNSGAVSALASITVRFSAADVWFGNDESGSVDKSDFRQARELISGTADLMDFGTDDVGFNAALFSWADSGSQQMELSLTADKTGFVDDSSSYRRNFDGGTDVGNGLLFGMNQILDSVADREAAGHARAGVPQVLVMMTDATSSQILNDDSLLADAAAAKAAGITIVFVAIQEAQEDPDALAILQQAASLDSNGDPLVVTAATYDSISASDMASLLQTIREAAASSMMPPVVIDLDHDGAEFVALSHGIDFDTDGDGQTEHTAWAHSDDAVLVYDRDSNGLVDGRAEVAFKDYDPNADTDLEGLRAFDTDQDGLLDADDEQFDLFNAWQDADGDGLVDDGEMLSLTELGIESIALTSDGISYSAADGDIIVHGTADVNWADGTTGEAADASFAYVEKQGPGDSTIEPEFDPEPIEIMTDSGEVINLDEPTVCVGLPEVAVCEMAPPCEEEAPVPAPQAAPDDEAAAAAAAMAA